LFSFYIFITKGSSAVGGIQFSFQKVKTSGKYLMAESFSEYKSGDEKKFSPSIELKRNTNDIEVNCEGKIS